MVAVAARGARPRRVSAKRSWPPGCGRFLAAPEVGDGEKGAAAGVVEGRAEEAAGHAGVSSAACNGGLPHAPPQPETERVVERGEAQPPGDGAFAAPRSCAVSAANGSVDSGGYGADSLLVEGKGGQGSGQLVREEEKVTGCGDGSETGSRADDGELERKDGDRKKRWLMSVVNLPPKRRAVSAMRRFPPGCGKPAVTGTSIGGEEGLVLEATPVSFASSGAYVADDSPTVPISGPGASPLFRRDVSNKEMDFKRAEVEGATKAHNWIQESQVVNDVVPDDFARGRHDVDHPQNAITKDSARHGFAEKMNGKRPSYEGKRVALVAGDGDVRSKCRGSLQEGTPMTPVRGLVNMKTKGKGPESVKMNETLLDDAWVSGGGMVRNKTRDTQRGMVCSNINMKQDMVARKLKHDGIRKGSFNRSVKESKYGNHVATDQIEENDDFDLVTDRLIVQALVAPDKCPWTQGKKSVASVSQSLTPRNKLKKKDATPRKELLPKVTPSTSTRHETREEKEDSARHGFAEKMNGKRPSYEGKRVALVAGDGDVRSKCGGSSQEGTPTIPVRGLVDVKTKGKGPESVKMNETLLDDACVSGGGTVRNRTRDTQRGMVCSNINMKKDIVARKLKCDGIRKGSFNRSAKESKCGNHVATNQIEENDDFDLVTDRLIVQALVAPDKCPWTQGKKSIASVSQSLTPRNKLKKKDATPGIELLPKVTPSTSTRK